jgi:hypothetical protein
MFYLLYGSGRDEDVLIAQDSKLINYLRSSPLHDIELNYPLSDILFFRSLAEKQVLFHYIADIFLSPL